MPVTLFIKKFLFLIPLIALVLCEKTRFDNYVLYKVLVENDQHYRILVDLKNNNFKYDIWNDHISLGRYVDIMSSPEDKAELEKLFQKYELKYEIANENIQEVIDKENAIIKTYTRSNIRSMEWNAYYTLDHIYGWLDDVAAAYPNVASIVIAGKSYEGRDIKGLKISHGPGRRVIFIESGIHAREWISMTSACYVINELLISNNTQAHAAAQDYDWYIFPVTNPDGYVYSHEQNRLWRKSRRPIGNNFGVDLNRNWNSNWLVVGASTNPQSLTYAGPGPFSEPETRALSNFIRSIGDKIDLYLSVHSFGQYLLVPFGNSTGAYANYYDAVNIGRRAMGALAVRYGTLYQTGNIAEVLYLATGGSDEWVKEHVRVPLVYCVELRDRGLNGFLLPEDEILPNNQEYMDGVLELIYQAERFGYMNSGSRIHISMFILLITFFISFL
ncbi:unnamed protein product [Euphydryas editha]|uniref:Zinc carboxypeptidase A 1 n=1 Tax=Euphydryas editha TaxID=104508 RepID=A0AAU9U669_EUPED|nr:unnamed protein product [Euphydryas editha]